MSTVRFAAGLAILVCCASTVATTRADFHLYYIREIFSNHDGSVQFIELFTTATGQQNLHPNHTITSTGHTFPFPSDGPTPTNNRALLLATEDFGDIPGGAVPNFVIPSNFFDPAGDTINFGEGVSIHTFGGANPLPIDGVNSRNYTGFFGTGTIAVNSPRNHAGAGTSVNLPPPPMIAGDFNGDDIVDAADYTTWRNNLGGDAAVFAEGSRDPDLEGPISLDDYDTWKATYGNDYSMAGGGAAAAVVPEPAAAGLAALAMALAAALLARQRR
jgi:hypothetical protein